MAHRWRERSRARAAGRRPSLAVAVGLLAGLSAGCGGRSGLLLGVDAGRDGATEPPFDAGPPDAAPDADGGPVGRCVQAPDSVELTFRVPLPRADVVLLVDATGSMTQEIDRLRATFVEEVLPAMQELVVDLQLAVAAFGDFSAPPYGRPGPDRPFVLLQRSTADASRIARALEDIPCRG